MAGAFLAGTASHKKWKAWLRLLAHRLELTPHVIDPAIVVAGGPAVVAPGPGCVADTLAAVAGGTFSIA